MRTKEEINKRSRELYAEWRAQNPCLRSRRKIGDRIGRLTIIARGETLPNGVVWICRCDCGKETRARTSNLGRGVKSCGCWKTNPPINWRTRLKKYATQEEAALSSLYQSYQYSAKHRGLVFDLPFEVFKRLTKETCFYCGAEPAGDWKLRGCTGKLRGSYTFNGVDRQKNHIGYFESNCVSCCGVCNLMKTDMSNDEFIQHAQKIASQHVSS